MTVKELITKLLEIPLESNISMQIMVDGERVSYPIIDFDKDTSLSHIICESYDTLMLKEIDNE